MILCAIQIFLLTYLLTYLELRERVWWLQMSFLIPCMQWEINGVVCMFSDTADIQVQDSYEQRNGRTEGRTLGGRLNSVVAYYVDSIHFQTPCSDIEYVLCAWSVSASASTACAS